MLSSYLYEKFWFLPKLIEVGKSPCNLESQGLLDRHSHQMNCTPVSEPLLVDHFEVKEVNKDLEADNQAEDSEDKRGFLEEDGK